ncbi:MAG: UvrD-helicase domain-containing protein [Acidobacteria bacterium]|nr:UvrD-helicase domain-containing protein [Acidobacteriota bacterium]
MQDLLTELNSQQQEAVTATEGPLLILAGAGSGKTRVITFRIAYLIEQLQVAPENILAVTFTNKAADQMKDRVAKLLGRDNPAPSHGSPHLSTFHSFCVRVLRRDISRLGISRNFTIYDDDAQQATVKICTRELGLEDQFSSPRAALSRISAAKNRGLTAEALYAGATNPIAERLASLFELYNRKLRQAQALDFDDLLLKAVELFESAPDVRDTYNQRFRYLLVDEFQDTNRLQYDLIRHLTRQHRNLCVVGDEDQSIYRWRGADIQNILNFEQDFPQARLIRLEQNYRSTQLILDAATAVVSHNRARKGKVLQAVRSGGQPVGFFEAYDGEEEAIYVAQSISQLQQAEPDSSSTMTVGVLYRTNAQSRLLEEALRRAEVGYNVVGGVSFYDRAEVKDVLAYARLTMNPSDTASLMRIINTPARGFGKKTLEILEEGARQAGLTTAQAFAKRLYDRNSLPQLSASKLLAVEAFQNLLTELGAGSEQSALGNFFNQVLDRTGYLQMLRKDGTPESLGRGENLEELVNAASEAENRGESLAEFLDHAALVSDTDKYRENSRVALMTLHSAKGLEFSQVFLVGLEEGLLPHAMSIDEEADLEEERRLCYVGMTRAKDRLIITRANRRRTYASYADTVPSRFLAEMPPEVFETVPSAPEPIEKPRTAWQGSLNSPAAVEKYFRSRGGAVKPGTRRKSASAGTGSRRRSSGRASGRWSPGTEVRHPKFGLGTIMDCEEEGNNIKLTIRFPRLGVKKIMEKFVSLETR